MVHADLGMTAGSSTKTESAIDHTPGTDRVLVVQTKTCNQMIDREGEAMIEGEVEVVTEE